MRMTSGTGPKGIASAGELLQAGVGAFPLLPLRVAVFAKLGPTFAWALLSALALVPFLTASILNQADLSLYGALGSAALGIFLCNWGSIYGLQALLASSDSFASVLEGEREEIRQVFLSRLREACSLRRTVLGGLAAAVVVTGVLFLQNSISEATVFARSFTGMYYIIIFLAAFGIGVGHVCILCMLRLVHIVKQFGFRRLHSVVQVYDLSKGYLKLASVCLVVYINYLLYLYFMWLGGVRFSTLVNILAAAVGAIVLIVYLYPQLVIHKELKANRRRLIEGAIAHLEKITAKDHISGEHKEEIIKALDYLARVQTTPTWGFQLRELAAVLVANVIPFLTFLEAQEARLRSLL